MSQNGATALIRKISEFRPHPLLAGGHRQTLAASYLPVQDRLTDTRQHRVQLADGDQLVLHENCPENWGPQAPVAMLVHGLCGCHRSRYIRRIAWKLHQRGVRVFRLDLRGCGAGQGLARTATHCGRASDLELPIQAIGELAPRAPLTVIGFSLGAALTLQLAAASSPPSHWKSVVAVCPPIDLLAVEQILRGRINCRYDRYFARLLWKQVLQRARTVPGAPGVAHLPRPRKLREFDQLYTVPLGGYRDADDYYHQTSVASRLHRIELPTRILAAANDPIVPIEPFQNAKLGPRTELLITPCGGHLGFVGRRGDDPDRFWMDWRIVEWTLGEYAERIPSAWSEQERPLANVYSPQASS